MPIDKLKIANSFSRAAVNYDSAAYLQREVGQMLLAMLETQSAQSQSTPSELHDVSTLVDLGCGTGYFSSYLESLCPCANYLGLDIAEGMLGYANDQHLPSRWLCADAEQLPLGDNTIDCFFSNLTLQWCRDLTTVFSELMRSLAPGGHICFSTLGPTTLWELRAAWRQVDYFMHVNEFYPVDYWIAAIEKAGLRVKMHSIALKVLQYDQVSQLTRELKTLGAHNMNNEQRPTLSGRQRVQQLHQAYEIFRKQGKLPATYEVYYWLLNKPLSTIDAT